MDQAQKYAAQEVMNLITGLNLSVEQLCELHGLYRDWGHPTVDEIEGCRGVKDIAQNRPIPDYNTIKEMLGLFKRQFIISSISIHGRWPKCSIPAALHGSSLQQAIDHHFKAIHLHSFQYPLTQWAEIEFGQEFKLDYHLGYTDLIDDKSLAVERDQIRSVYSPDSLGYRTETPRTDRRSVRELLRREELNIKAIREAIQLGLVPENWKVVIIHAKEREMKIAPRLFAMMTLEMRLFLCNRTKHIKVHL